jgi:hypothetical protein
MDAGLTGSPGFLLRKNPKVKNGKDAVFHPRKGLKRNQKP